MFINYSNSFRLQYSRSKQMNSFNFQNTFLVTRLSLDLLLFLSYSDNGTAGVGNDIYILKTICNICAGQWRIMCLVGAEGHFFLEDHFTDLGARKWPL